MHHCLTGALAAALTLVPTAALAHTGIGDDAWFHPRLRAPAGRARSYARDGHRRHLRLAARRPRAVAGAGRVRRGDGARRRAGHDRRAGAVVGPASPPR